MSDKRIELNRAAFLAGSVAALGAGLTDRAAAAEPPAGTAAGSTSSAERLLGRLMAGNERFVNNDFPDQSRMAVKRELLESKPGAFRRDSRLLRLARDSELDLRTRSRRSFRRPRRGNFPDDLVIASIEYAVEHLGTRLDHGARAIKTAARSKPSTMPSKTGNPLPPHLSTMQNLIAPGMKQRREGRRQRS